MTRDDYTLRFPNDVQSIIRSLAENYDKMLQDLKSLEAYYRSAPDSKLQPGSLYKSVTSAYITRIRTLADRFPKITENDTNFLCAIMGDVLTFEEFKANYNYSDSMFYRVPAYIEAVIITDNTFKFPPIANTYIESFARLLRIFILLKEDEFKEVNKDARFLCNKLVKQLGEKVNSEDAALKHRYEPPLFDESTTNPNAILFDNSPIIDGASDSGGANIIRKNTDNLLEGNAPQNDTPKTIVPKEAKLKYEKTTFSARPNNPSLNAANPTFDDLINELNSLIGLQAIKDDISNQIGMVRAQRIRAARGLKAVPISLHLVFTGNPGTGKTTVARLIAKLYKEIGVLQTGQLVEVDRAGLVAGYVGQTAIKTQEKIDEALGGVLFIDEAYSLVKSGNDYGMEAIETLLKAMEDHRDELVVIVAGYPDLMEDFINSNPGLRSRFSRFIHFPDYDEPELYQIFELLCAKYDYQMTPGAENAVKARIHQEKISQERNFANARTVRNIFETVITRQSVRTTNTSDNTELTLITESDVP